MDYIKGNQFKLENTSVTFGKFDGIHLGHRELIRYVQEDERLKSVLFTFDLNPLNLFSDKEIKLVYTNEERQRLLSDSGLAYLIDFPFSKEIADMRAKDFIFDIIHKQLGAKRIVVGTDFRFGKGREGDVALLEKYQTECGYKLIAVSKLESEGREISSTAVRKYIQNGEIEKANYLLGKPFFIAETIIHGRKLGHTVGMPTINQRPSSTKLLPPYGVYASITFLEGKFYKGITNIGVKPTVGEDFPGVETWLFDFNQNVYGKTATVYLLSFIRPEVKFSSLDELKKQVDRDVKKAKETTDKYSMEVE